MTYSIKYSEGFLLEGHDVVMKEYKNHYKEVRPEGMPDEVELDLSQIIYLSEMKAFFNVKATIEDKIVGICSGYIYDHMHYKGKKFATTSFIFADPSLGRKRIEVFQGLIKEFERIAKDKYNCEYIQVVITTKKDVSKLVEHLGYNKTDITLTKRI